MEQVAARWAAFDGGAEGDRRGFKRGGTGGLPGWSRVAAPRGFIIWPQIRLGAWQVLSARLQERGCLFAELSYRHVG